MSITAKIKDDTLKGILEGSMGCDRDIESILESDGYISVIRTNMANVCQITASGRAFIAQGGYTAIEQKKKRLLMETEAAKEKERQYRLQEIEIQHLVSERLMEKDHEFQMRQNRSNRRNNIISGIIAAIVTLAIQALIMALQ